MVAVRWQNVVDCVVLVGAIYLLLRWGKEARAFRVSVSIVSLKAAALLARQLDLIVTSLVLVATNLIAIILLLIVHQSELRRAQVIATVERCSGVSPKPLPRVCRAQF
jgi:hypothetical protein